MGYGSRAKMCVDAALPFDTSSEPYEYLTFGLKGTRQIVNTNGIRGTRSAHEARSRLGAKDVSGDITMAVSATMLDKWLPRILGGAEPSGGGDFEIAETVPEFQVMHDVVEKVISYTGCKVGRAVFRGSAQSPIVTVTLSILGKDYSVGNSGTFPVLTMPVDLPYLFEELVLEIDGTSRECQDFELTIDNLGEARRGNSFTATAIKTPDRIVTLTCNVPFESSETDLLEVARGGLAATMVWTPSGGDCETTITLPCLQIPTDLPTVDSRNQTMLRISAVARRTASAAEITITHDSNLP